MLKPHFARQIIAPFLAMLSTMSMNGQSNDVSPAATISRARSLYYTPVDQGFQGFRCEVHFDWKTFLEKASNQPVPESDARLKYLQSIRLSVDDDVRSGGALHWNATTPAPDNTEDSVTKLRGGLQQVWAGFLQSWNGFITGDLISLDAKALAERTPDGYRVSVLNTSSSAQESFDSALVLKQLRVTTPTLESTMQPVFRPGPHGMVLSSLTSRESQPPSSPPVEVKMEIMYAEVQHFQLPSELQVSVGPTTFDYHLSNCTVVMQTTTAKP